MKKLLAVYGSPRKGGNSSVLLDYFLEGTKASIYPVERVYLRDINFSFCVECRRCEKTGICSLDDDLTPIYEKIRHYERIVISCPVFFLGPPALTKAFIDRLQVFWVRKYVLGINPVPEGVQKKGFLLSVCGFKGHEKMFSCNRSIVKAVYTACGYSYTGELFYPGIDRFGDMKKRSDIREEAVHAGKDFVS